MADGKIRFSVEITGTDVPPEWASDVMARVQRELELLFGDRAVAYVEPDSISVFGLSFEHHHVCPRCRSPYKNMRSYVSEYVHGESWTSSGFRSVQCDDAWHYVDS